MDCTNTEEEQAYETFRKASKIVALVQWELEGGRLFRAGAYGIFKFNRSQEKKNHLMPPLPTWTD
jgi:hypothetical protein